MGAAGIILVQRTESVFKHILFFWVLCALHKECIEPTRDLLCSLQKMNSNKYAGRFYNNLSPSELKSLLTYPCHVVMKRNPVITTHPFSKPYKPKNESYNFQRRSEISSSCQQDLDIFSNMITANRENDISGKKYISCKD